MKKLLFILFLMFSIFNLSAVELTLNFDSNGQSSPQKEYMEYNNTADNFYYEEFSEDGLFIVHKSVWTFWWSTVAVIGVLSIILLILAMCQVL